MDKSRPSFGGLPDNLEYGQPFKLEVALPAGTPLEDIKGQSISLSEIILADKHLCQSRSWT